MANSEQPWILNALASLNQQMLYNNVEMFSPSLIIILPYLRDVSRPHLSRAMLDESIDHDNGVN